MCYQETGTDIYDTTFDLAIGSKLVFAVLFVEKDTTTTKQ